MSKAEETMRRLREQQQPPQWDIRQQLALALMHVDGQAHCRNCICRYRPCRVYQVCQAPERPHFQPKQSLMDMQLKRVNAIFEVIKNI